MKLSVNILKVIILIIGIIIIAFTVQLYVFCKQQRTELDAMSDQQKAQAQADEGKFKDQQDQISRLSKDLADAQQQIKSQNDSLTEDKDALDSQKDALLQEVRKRQQVENEGKDIQTSLIDIKAEADAIKQDMKGWQKDYVSVLAELSKKMDGNDYEMKGIEKNLTALNIPELKENIASLKTDVEKITHPPDNDISSAPAVLEKKDKDEDQPQKVSSY